MATVEQHGQNFRIYNGDCMELIKDVPDESVDLVLADLPYGITDDKWDFPLPLYALFREYRRITKERGAILLFGGEPFTSKLVLADEKNFRYKLVWNKQNSTGYRNARVRPLKQYEEICVFFKKSPTYNPQMRSYKVPFIESYGDEPQKVAGGVKFEQYYPTDVLNFKKEASKYTVHPTQKPQNLLKYLIKTYTNEGDTVLDNTMGSGSTGMAALSLDRKFIGMEIEPKYFNAASEALAQIEKDKNQAAQ